MGDKAALIGGDGTMWAREAPAPWARRGRSQCAFLLGASTSSSCDLLWKKHACENSERKKIKTEGLIETLPPISFLGERYHAVRPMTVSNVILTPPVLKICK